MEGRDIIEVCQIMHGMGKVNREYFVHNSGACVDIRLDFCSRLFQFFIHAETLHLSSQEWGFFALVLPCLVCCCRGSACDLVSVPSFAFAVSE